MNAWKEKLDFPLRSLEDLFLSALGLVPMGLSAVGAAMGKYRTGQRGPHLEPDAKSYFAQTPSPFVSSDWTITKDSLLTCE